MRILISSSLDLEKSLNSRLGKFVEYLASKDHEIVVLSIKDHWKVRNTMKNDSSISDETLDKVKIYYFTERKVYPYVQEFYSVLTLGKLLGKIDYRKFDVHVAADSLVSGYLIASKLKKANIPTVYDTSDNMPEMIKIAPQIPVILRHLGYHTGMFLVHKNVEVVDKIVVHGETLRKSLDIPPHKAIIIPNGVDASKFKEAKNDGLREKLGLSSCFIIGYVGALREWVNLEPVFIAMSTLSEKHPEIKVLVVGDEGYFEENKQLAMKHGVADHVIFAGHIPYSEVPKYISAMDVGLIPFKINRVTEDSCPLKLFEYMACNKPVISTRLSEVKKICGDDILYASNANEYITSIIKLYSDAGLRNQLGLNGRDFVEKNYDWNIIAKRFEEVLKNSISDTG